MTKILKIPVLVALFVFLFPCVASAEWLYAVDGQTYVHTEPDIDSERVGVFRLGQKIWVHDHVYTSDGRDWCEVLFGGRRAYISDRYSSYWVENDEDYTDVNPYLDEIDEGTCDDNYDDSLDDEAEFHFTSIKETPIYSWYEDGEVVSYLLEGSELVATIIVTSSDGRAWIEIPMDENTCGYVNVNRFTIQEGIFPELSNIMRVTADAINLRAAPNINGEILHVVERGTELYVDHFVCVFDGEYRIWAHCYDEYGNDLGYASCKNLTNG